MNKSQAITNFWKSFGIPAYEESTVREDVEMPYITFNTVIDDFDHPVNLVGNLWYKGTHWTDIDLKLEEITKFIGTDYKMKIDGGYMWIVKGHPYAQRVSDENKTVRRVYINLTAEFLTAI